MPTDNHDLIQPPRGKTPWDTDWYQNFDSLDTLVEIRDTGGNRTNYTPSQNARFTATDTENVYIGTGTSWRRLQSTGTHPTFGSVNADSVDTTTASVEAAPVASTDVVRLTDLDGFDGGGTGSESTVEYGIGGYHTATGDGTTTRFQWSTGIDTTNSTIEWITIDPATVGASPDFTREVSGADLVVTYASPPADGEPLGWYWRAATVTEALPEGYGEAGYGGTDDTAADVDIHGNDRHDPNFVSEGGGAITGNLDVTGTVTAGDLSGPLDGVSRDEFAMNTRTFSLESGSAGGWWKVARVSEGSVMRDSRFNLTLDGSGPYGNSPHQVIRGVFGARETNAYMNTSIEGELDVPQRADIVTTVDADGHRWLYIKSSSFLSAVLTVQHTPRFGFFDFSKVATDVTDTTAVTGTIETDTETDSPSYDFAGGDIEADTTTTETAPRVDASHPAYGAAGDGTTDDTQAILDAITAAQTAGTPVYLPPGTYSITSPIDLGGVHLTGAGMGETVISVDATMPEAVTVSAADGGASDLTIDCNLSAQKGLYLNATRAFATRVEATDVSQYGATTTTTACIAAFSSTQARIEHCRASGARAPNTGVSRGILVDGSNGGGEVEISHCAVADIQPTSDGDGIVVQSSNPRSRVVNCTVTAAAKSAIKVNLGAENTVVTGNTLHTSPPGLSVMRIQASGTEFTGNTISQPDVGGELVRVSDAAGDVTIAGNTLEITAGTGNCECIRVRDTEANVAINGNAINMHNTGRHGIQIDASPGISIGDNTIRNVGQRGINLEGPVNCSVVGNSINGTGAHGIFVATTCSKVVITGNAITQDAGFEAISDTGAVATIGTNAT